MIEDEENTTKLDGIDELMEPETKIESDEIHIDQFIENAEQSIQNENSTSFPFGNNAQSDLTALYDQSSAGGGITEDAPQATDSIDNLLANLAEDNANSLPSGDDETRFAPALENSHVLEQNDDNGIQENSHLVEQQSNTDAPEEMDQVELVPLEQNEPIAEENMLNTSTEDIINEIISDAEKIDVDESEASSLVAIAEDLLNGDNSQSTKVDIDAEMVSEDELPAPSQEKVDDAEEVSDEELPGPKLAELPADTEVVSEDELPSSNKVKRKIDEGYDPNSPTESSEVPEKKIKADDEVEDEEGM